MSALNMAMNGNAYKMIEIKKVSGPVVPLTSLNPLNPLTTLTDRYEPLPNPQNQRIYTDLSHNHNPAYNPHSQSNGASAYTPLTQQASSGTLQRAVPPPPPSRDATLSRVEAAPPAKAGQEGQGRAAVEGAVPAAGAATPPSRPQEETNGVAIVSQQELDFNTKEDEKWWWVCCLEFCFCLL